MFSSVCRFAGVGLCWVLSGAFLNACGVECPADRVRVGSACPLPTDGGVDAADVGTDGGVDAADAGVDSDIIQDRCSLELGVPCSVLGPTYLKSPSPDNSKFFGAGVSVSGAGTIVAIGEPLAGAPRGENIIPVAGVVHLFERDNTDWNSAGFVAASNAGPGDAFGISIAMSDDGDTLVVGADEEQSVGASPTDNSLARAGAVYVFRKTTGSWQEEARLKSSLPVAQERFGRSVALSADGTVLAVGAPGHSGGQGAVYVFRHAGSEWSAPERLLASNGEAGDGFAVPVLSGDGSMLVVGAPGEDGALENDGSDNAAQDSGAAYGFRFDTNWTETGRLKADPPVAGSELGTSLAMNRAGNLLVAGAPELPNDAGARAGRVQFFRRIGDDWDRLASAEPTNRGISHRFGSSVGMDEMGTRVVVGSLGDSLGRQGIHADPTAAAQTGSGAIHVFDVSAVGAVTELSHLKAPNGDSGDNLAAHLALSRDGSLVAVGAIAEQSNGAGTTRSPENNSLTNAGAAYLFQLR